MAHRRMIWPDVSPVFDTGSYCRLINRQAWFRRELLSTETIYYSDVLFICLFFAETLVLQKILGILIMSISLNIQETLEGKCALRQCSNMSSVFTRNIMVFRPLGHRKAYRPAMFNYLVEKRLDSRSDTTLCHTQHIPLVSRPLNISFSSIFTIF